MSIVSRQGGGYSGFSPSDIGGLSLWLDAADSSTLGLSGSNVTQWRDKSGNGTILTSGSTFYPTYATNQINGYSAIQYASGNYLDGVFTNTTQMTLCMVYTLSSTTGFGALVGFNDGYGNFHSPYVTGPLNSDAFIWLKGTTWPSQALYTSTTPQIGPRIYSVLVNGTGTQVFRNGIAATLLGSGFNGTATGSRITIGRNSPTGGDTFVGSIGEIIGYSGILSTTERQQIEGYLAHKWGLYPNLPTAHPFLRYKPIARRFQPSDTGSLALWLDAADSSTLTLSGSNVTQWRDKSGLNRVGTGANGFTYSAGNIPAITNTSRVTGTHVGRINMTLNRPFSVFTVARLTDTTQNSFVLDGEFLAGGSSTRIVPFHFAPQVGNFAPSVWGSFHVAGASNSLSTRGVHCVNVRAGNATEMITNGTLANTGDIGNYSLRGITVGARFSGTNQWMGDIHEILIYSSILSTQQRQQVEAYLAHKWGLRNSLPTSHIFRSQIPQVPILSGPLTFPGCALWLDAADSSSVVLSGSNVSQWKDKSGNGYVGTVMNSPLWQTNVSGGLPVVRFNGVNQYINFGNILNLGTNGITIFFLGKFIINPGNQVGMIGKSSYRGNLARWAMGYDTVSQGQTGIGIYNFIEGNAGPLVAFAHDPNVQFGIYCAQNNRTSFNQLYLDGSLKANATFTGSVTNLSNSDPLYIAAYPNGTGSGPQSGMFLNGDISEILVYSNALSPQHRQQIEGYLAHKWGLVANLPPAHPFKKFRP